MTRLIGYQISWQDGVSVTASLQLLITMHAPLTVNLYKLYLPDHYKVSSKEVFLNLQPVTRH
jgi:hypothetical protein